MKHEFKAGDTVHFQAYTYDDPIRAVVKSLGYVNVFGVPEPRPPYSSGPGKMYSEEDTSRPTYKLDGLDVPLVTTTEGMCIVESKLFNPSSEGKLVNLPRREYELIRQRGIRMRRRRLKWIKT